MDLVDLLKLSGGGLYGPSKILFTIKEEEKEEMESVCSNSAEKGPEWKCDGGRRSLEDCFQIEQGTPEIKPAVVCSTADHCCVNIETTPFATPCASPSYFTPLASPGRGLPINSPPPAPDV
ncbi:unnamed protein product [Cuscuta campestris]|uniref:Uncharacterized protein n=1 Tax=Cuscuta campestris TaxID=132261 RepID=A0A484KBN6_9ASTE|nr:unnamed protein product [Cuscuta campestris]